MSIRHPGRSALQAWLSGADDQDLERHLDDCQRCANTLEELDATDAPTIGAALADALSPPGDLTERLVAGVNEKLSSRQIMGVVADIFGAGLETTRMLIIEEHNDDN